MTKWGSKFESASFEIWRILGGLFFLGHGGLQCENLSGLTLLTTKCGCRRVNPKDFPSIQTEKLHVQKARLTADNFLNAN